MGSFRQCSQSGLAYLACSSSGLEQGFKPLFLTPLTCLSMISVRLIACKQFEQACGQVLSGKSCHKPRVDAQARTTKRESDSFLVLLNLAMH